MARNGFGGRLMRSHLNPLWVGGQGAKQVGDLGMAMLPGASAAMDQLMDTPAHMLGALYDGATGAAGSVINMLMPGSGALMQLPGAMAKQPIQALMAAGSPLKGLGRAAAAAPALGLQALGDAMSGGSNTPDADRARNAAMMAASTPRATMAPLSSSMPMPTPPMMGGPGGLGGLGMTASMLGGSKGDGFIPWEMSKDAPSSQPVLPQPSMGERIAMGQEKPLKHSNVVYGDGMEVDVRDEIAAAMRRRQAPGMEFTVDEVAKYMGAPKPKQAPGMEFTVDEVAKYMGAPSAPASDNAMHYRPPPAATGAIQSAPSPRRPDLGAAPQIGERNPVQLPGLPPPVDDEQRRRQRYYGMQYRR